MEAQASKFTCPVCFKVYSSYGAMRSHKSRDHKVQVQQTKESYLCGRCMVSFTAKLRLTSHECIPAPKKQEEEGKVEVQKPTTCEIEIQTDLSCFCEESTELSLTQINENNCFNSNFYSPAPQHQPFSSLEQVQKAYEPKNFPIIEEVKPINCLEVGAYIKQECQDLRIKQWEQANQDIKLSHMESDRQTDLVQRKVRKIKDKLRLGSGLSFRTTRLAPSNHRFRGKRMPGGRKRPSTKALGMPNLGMYWDYRVPQTKTKAIKKPERFYKEKMLSQRKEYVHQFISQALDLEKEAMQLRVEAASQPFFGEWALLTGEAQVLMCRADELRQAVRDHKVRDKLLLRRTPWPRYQVEEQEQEEKKEYDQDGEHYYYHFNFTNLNLKENGVSEAEESAYKTLCGPLLQKIKDLIGQTVLPKEAEELNKLTSCEVFTMVHLWKLLTCYRKKLYNLKSNKRSVAIIQQRVREVTLWLDTVELVIVHVKNNFEAILLVYEEFQMPDTTWKRPSKRRSREKAAGRRIPLPRSNGGPSLECRQAQLRNAERCLEQLMQRSYELMLMDEEEREKQMEQAEEKEELVAMHQQQGFLIDVFAQAIAQRKEELELEQEKEKEKEKEEDEEMKVVKEEKEPLTQCYACLDEGVPLLQMLYCQRRESCRDCWVRYCKDQAKEDTKDRLKRELAAYKSQRDRMKRPVACPHCHQKVDAVLQVRNVYDPANNIFPAITEVTLAVDEEEEEEKRRQQAEAAQPVTARKERAAARQERKGAPIKGDRRKNIYRDGS